MDRNNEGKNKTCIKKILEMSEREGKQSNKVPVRTLKKNCLTTRRYNKVISIYKFCLKSYRQLTNLMPFSYNIMLILKIFYFLAINLFDIKERKY